MKPIRVSKDWPRGLKPGPGRYVHVTVRDWASRRHCMPERYESHAFERTWHEIVSSSIGFTR